MLSNLQQAIRALGPIKRTASILKIHPRTVIRLRKGQFHPQLTTIALSPTLVKALVADAEEMEKQRLANAATPQKDEPTPSY